MATYLGAVIAPSADYPGYYAAVECYLDSQDIATNVSTGHNVVTAVAAGSLRDFTATYWSHTISGATTGFADGSAAANFISGNFVLNGNVPWTATHDTDGKRTITVAFNWAGASGGNFANGFAGSAAFTLPQISRATTPTLPTTADIGSALTISLPRANAIFTHDVTFQVGSASGTIATGAGVSTSWTPAMSLLSQIPAGTSVTCTITVVTKNGSTVVGTRSATMTLTAPASAVPSFTTVTHAEGTTSPNVATIVGGYVQGISKLTLAITGAAGLHGSTITAYKIEVLKGSTLLATLTAASGTTPPINETGTLTLRGTVTDSRNRSVVKTVTVTFLAYEKPSVTGVMVRRADAAGTVTPPGIYARVDFIAAVQTLDTGTEKNALQYRVLTKPRNSPTWSNPGWVTPGGLGFASYAIAAGTVPTGESRDVRVEVRDALGIVTTIQSVLTTAAAALFLSKLRDAVSVGMEYDEAVGGSLQAAEVMYQNVDKRVLDVTDLATTTAQGIVELATSTEVAAGTDAERAVTPSTLLGRTATEARIGLAEIATKAEIIAGTDGARIVTPLRLKEANAERPAFEATANAVTNNSGAASRVKVAMAREDLDIGGCYNPTLSRFTAPVKGIYEISVAVVQTTAALGPVVSLYRNGTLDTLATDIIIAYGQYVTVSKTLRLTLNAADYLEVWVLNANGATIQIGGYGTGWGGHLVQEVP